jgi:hypothetical protein
MLNIFMTMATFSSWNSIKKAHDVAFFRLFKPVRSEPLHDNNRKFLHIPFANKGIDAINISNILNRKGLYECDEFQKVSVY